MTALMDDPLVCDALGDGPELTAEQTKLLTILLDPANDPRQCATSREGMLDELSDFSAIDLEDSITVGNILSEYHSRRTGRSGEFVFEHIRDSDGTVDSYNVLTAHDSAGIWLAASADSKYLIGDRYGLKGLRAALKIAETLSDDYARIPRPDAAKALNRAADEVLEIADDDGEERLRDAVNLVVNAALHYLEHPAADLDAAIAANYDDPDEVLGQLR